MFPGGYGNDVVIHTKETEIHYPTSSTTASIISVTAVGMQGARRTMEDKHSISLGMGDGKISHSLFSVFDGHGGSHVARYIANEVKNKLQESDSFDETSCTSEIIEKSLVDAYIASDDALRSACKSSAGEQPNADKVGATGVSCYLTNEDIVVSWVGDSRCVLFSGEKSYGLTVDHKPGRESERTRILGAGGTVIRGRINGELAVARSFGDFFYKNVKDSPNIQMVSCVPDTTAIKRAKDKDQFVILACDGIWDVITNQDACLFVAELISMKQPLDLVAAKLIDYCLLAGSKDNMTVLICAFDASNELKSGTAQRNENWADVPKYNSQRHTVQRFKSIAGVSMQQQEANERQRKAVIEEEKSNQIIISIPASTHSDVSLGLVKSEVLTWDENEIVDKFLKRVGWDNYIETFVAEGVDGQLFLMLTHTDCMDDLLMTARDAHFLITSIQYCNSHVR